jgi:hypothetical protein
LPDLARLPPDTQRTEHLILQSAEQRQELLGVIQHDHGSLRMTLLSLQGQRLLTLVHDKNGARFLPGAPFDPPFSAHWLASRIAWTLWSPTELRRSFRGSAWRVRQDETGHSVYHLGRRVARIVLSAHCTLIDDTQAGYRLYIIPVESTLQQAGYPCPAI